MRSASIAAVLLLGAAACGGEQHRADSNDPDHGGRASGSSGATGAPEAGKGNDPAAGGATDPPSAGGNGESAGGGAAAAAGDFTPLSDHELYLVGVWRGTISQDDQEFSYFVLQADRTGCGWDRHGTNFGQRFFAYSFSDWQLEETPLDDDQRMTLRLVSSAGETQSIERYDAATDRIYIGGYQATSWLDLLIPCDSAGTNATQTEVERQGTALPKP
jgi:hypothetical protein